MAYRWGKPRPSPLVNDGGMFKTFTMAGLPLKPEPTHKSMTHNNWES